MAQDIYIEPGELSSRLLSNSRQHLETSCKKLKSIDSCPVYHGPDGCAQLYPLGIISQLSALADKIDNLEERLGKYAQVMDSEPDALAEIDDSCRNNLTNAWERTGYCFGIATSPIVQGFVGLFSVLFCTNAQTAQETEVYQSGSENSDVQIDSADKLDTVSDFDKQKIIIAFEAENPDTAQKLDRYLTDTGLADSDIENIKYLIYTAPEPYRSLYLEYVESYKMKLKENGISNHNSLTNVITIVDDQSLSNDPHSPYTTFFHESGHAIDDFERSGIMFGAKMAYRSSKYEYQNKTMYECIVDDVRKNVSEYIDTTYDDLTDEQRNTILRSMNLTDDAEFVYKARNNGLSDSYLDQIRTEVLDHYVYEELAGYDNNAVCDIYGGITNEVFYEESTYENGVYLGHANNSTYWYGKINVLKGSFSGENCDLNDHTGRQAAELWAEFFAAKMTRNEAALANMKEHFPTAYEAMEQMAQDMAKTD